VASGCNQIKGTASLEFKHKHGRTRDKLPIM
jgi:hypothetical protein